MIIRESPGQTAAALVLSLVCCVTASAGTLTAATLVAPLAPEQESRLSLPMPAGFASDQEVWIAYELVALSPTDDSEGELGIEQSFEGVMTPVSALFTSFNAGRMDSRESAGTIAQRLEQLAGPRKPEELRSLMGDELFAAYEAVNAGKGRVLGGRLVRRLPAPGRSDAPLLVSVERATGMQPLALKVTVGQGTLPAEFQGKTADSLAYKAGYAGGLAAFGWLVMRFFRRRRD